MKDYEELKKLAAQGGFVTLPSHTSKNHLAGWRNPGDDLILKNQKPDKEFPYDLSYRDDTGKKYYTKGKVKAETSEQARAIVEYYPKASGMKKVWCCIYVFKKMEIFDGNGM